MLIEQSRLDHNKNIERKTIFTYDTDGLKASESLINAMGVKINTMTFNKDGHDIGRMDFDDTGNVYRKMIKIFDEYGNLLEEGEFDGNGESIGQKLVNEYTSDSQDNWITQKVISDGIPNYVIERDINYY